MIGIMKLIFCLDENISNKMYLILIFSILYSSSLPVLRAECPNIRDIPTMWPNGTKLPHPNNTIMNEKYSGNFTCAQYWNGPGGQYPIDSCNGDSWIIPDTYDMPLWIPIVTCAGSILVKPGCTLYQYEWANYAGDMYVKF